MCDLPPCSAKWKLMVCFRLEMVDSKHRYGSNLKWYHQRVRCSRCHLSRQRSHRMQWNEEDTEDNFFEVSSLPEG